MPKVIVNCPECGRQIEYYPRANHRNGAKHFCSRHCQSKYLARQRPVQPVGDRFFSKVVKNPDNGCWEWTGAHGPAGHGQFVVDHKKVVASRFSWELHFGKIPDGMEVCHKCDNPPCVNPEHLFLGTQGDNMRDCSAKGRLNNWNAAKTHCKHGHEYTPENSYLNKKGGRVCKKCAHLHSKKAAVKRKTLRAMDDGAKSLFHGTPEVAKQVSLF